MHVVTSSRSKDPFAKAPSERPTVVPVAPSSELAARPAARPTPRSRPAVREAQVTITNEDALEEARLASMQSMPTPLPVPVPSSVPQDRPSRVATGRPGPPANLRGDMRERMTLGDFVGALELADRLLAESPSDDEATRTARECRETLTDLYEGKLGSLDRVPYVVVARDELRFLALDHRAGFLLSHIDGVSPLDSILDVSGMPRLDALRILVELVQKRVVSLR